MSHLYAIFFVHEAQLDLPAPAIFEICGENYSLAICGGKHSFSVVDIESSKHFICGVTFDGSTPTSARKWREHIEQNTRPEYGHFLRVSFDGTKLYAENDALGLRDLYFARSARAVFVSSDAYWVARNAYNVVELDINAFGSLWNTGGQLNFDCILKNVRRLGAGGRAIFTEKTENLTQSIIHFDRTGAGSLDDTLAKFMQIVNLNPTLPAKLALSGGLDSRAIFAGLLGLGRKSEFFTAGFVDEPDAIIAKQLTTLAHMNFAFASLELPTGEKLLQIWQNHAREKLLTAPLAVAPLLSVISAQMNALSFCLDGGLGEIVRRRVYRKLSPYDNFPLTPRRAVRLLKKSTPVIFCAEVRKTLDEAFTRDVHAAFELFPNANAAQLAENWAIYFRSANFQSHEQARLDCITQAIMPFLQLPFLRAALDMPAHLRKNSAVHLSVIKRFTPWATKIPLARFGRILPFAIAKNALLLRLSLPLFDDFGNRFQRNWLRNNFQLCREFIEDSAASNFVAQCELFDAPEIRRTVHNYFSGNDAYYAALDSFLSLYFLLCPK